MQEKFLHHLIMVKVIKQVRLCKNQTQLVMMLQKSIYPEKMQMGRIKSRAVIFATSILVENYYKSPLLALSLIMILMLGVFHL